MITTTDIEKLAELARIKITSAEKESFSKEIDSILGYVDELQKVSADMTHTPIARNVMRDDANPNLTGTYTQAILNEVPDREGDFVAVKKILS